MAEITLPQSSEPAIRWKKPVILTALVLFGLYSSTHMVAAGDTWVALACGRHFANHGVDTVEPFSFNSHPSGPSDAQLAAWPQWTHGIIRYWHPTGWINQNWLTHLTFYKLVTLFGSEDQPNYNMLVYWKFALFIATAFCVFALGKLLGAGDFWAMAAACFAMVVGRSFYDIRPACYSNLLVPLFILLLALSTYKNYKAIWLMIPLIIFWANVHGGYLYAYIMVTPFLAVHILLNLPRRWTVAVGLSGLWMVLYLLYYKFQTNTYYLEMMRFQQPDFEKLSLINSLFFATGLMAIASFVLAAIKRVPAGLFYSFHSVASIAYVFVLLSGFLVKIPAHITPAYRRILDYLVTSNLCALLFLFLFGGAIVILLAIRKERFVRIPSKTIVHVFAASAVSFLAMILFNPFHLTNLTHTFEISISEHAASWRSVNEWRPAFDWMDPTTDRPNPVGDEEAFAVMCVLAVIAFVVWTVLHSLKPGQRPLRKGPRQSPLAAEPADTGWPKVDLALTLVGVLTIYMALQSRRFIALAGPSASPVLAMVIFQIGQMFTARANWNKNQTLSPVMPSLIWQKYTWLAASALLAVLAMWGSWQYYRIYLAPWPPDDGYHSVFMRMTASNQKPFEVCDFINANKLSGRIFNYWTEGGGLAFGQTPDPVTGKTPLQHFMDGRAQAAFDHETFQKWQELYTGGSVATKILRTGKKPTPEELNQIGQWIDAQLKENQVWIALIPKSQSDATFMTSLQRTPNWKTAFLDEKQHLIVDTDHEQGRQLIADILEGRAIFPDEFSKNMTVAKLVSETDPRRVTDIFDHATAAFQVYPYPSATILMTQIARAPTCREAANKTLRDYLADFTAQRSRLARKNGYGLRLTSALIAAQYLLYAEPQDSELKDVADSLRQELKKLNSRSNW